MSSEMTIYDQGKSTLQELQEKVKTLQVTDESLNFVGETLAIAKRLVTVLDDERIREGDPHFRIYKEVNDRYGILIKPCKEIADKIEKMIASFNRAKKEEVERKQREYERQLQEAEEKRLVEERRIREEQERQAREAEAKRLAEERRMKEEQERRRRELEAKAKAEGMKKSELDKLRREAEEKRLAEETRFKREQELRRLAEEESRRRELLKAQQDAIIAPFVAPEAPKEKIATTIGSVKIKDKWTFNVVDISKVSRDLMMIDEKRVLKLINAKEGPLRNAEGLEIFPEE